jgi:hypothetical protein
MDVIIHQTPGKDFYVKTLRLFPYCLQVIAPVIVAMKDVHRTHTALGDMMRIAAGYNSGNSSHIKKL